MGLPTARREIEFIWDGKARKRKGRAGRPLYEMKSTGLVHQEDALSSRICIDVHDSLEASLSCVKVHAVLRMKSMT